MDKPIHIVIADDHPIVRAGLRASIEKDHSLKLVGEASDGEMAVALIKGHRPQIVVLDIDMPKLDGLGVAREIRRRKLDAKIIFLTLHRDQDFFQDAMELGGSGYILKDSAMLEIVAGVHAVAEGRSYISAAVAAPNLSRRQPQASPQASLASLLTATERRIMRLIANGKSSKEIGTELSIHYRTVENHRTNICRKLALEGEGPNALLRFALQNKNSL